LGELGFGLIRQLHNPKQRHGPSFPTFGEFKKGPDLYEFVANDPILYVDLLGLNLQGGDAEQNPGGVNGVPYMVLTYDPCSGKTKASNNDDPAGLLLAWMSPLIGAGGGAAIEALAGLTAYQATILGSGAALAYYEYKSWGSNEADPELPEEPK